MIIARIRIRSKTHEMATAIVQSVSPDNIGMKGLKVESRISSENAFFSLKHTGKIETFISTLDDILRCIQTAKSTLDRITKEKQS